MVAQFVRTSSPPFPTQRPAAAYPSPGGRIVLHKRIFADFRGILYPKYCLYSNGGLASGSNPRSVWVGGLMAFEVMVDPETLREQVKEKYREVAMNPRGSF